MIRYDKSTSDMILYSNPRIGLARRYNGSTAYNRKPTCCDLQWGSTHFNSNARLWPLAPALSLRAREQTFAGSSPCLLLASCKMLGILESFAFGKPVQVQGQMQDAYRPGETSSPAASSGSTQYPVAKEETISKLKKENYSAAGCWSGVSSAPDHLGCRCRM